MALHGLALLTLVSCDQPPQVPLVPSLVLTRPEPTSPPVTSPAPTTTPPGPPPPDSACPRAADFADWPGGRTMQLHVPEQLTIGDTVTIGADGASPGDRVTFSVGPVCALDCPPENDGACFQPTAPVLLGEAVADALGHATIRATVADWAPQAWFAIQAAAPDAAQRALSQVVVDRLYEGPPYLDLLVISPGTYRNLGSEAFVWPVAPGRRIRYDLTPTVTTYGYTETVADGIVSPAPFMHHGFDALVATSVVFDAVSYWGGPFSLELATEPLSAAVPWYPDGDGDGYGDVRGQTVMSATVLSGYSADPRDCDDADPNAHPWADDTCDDGVDTDCDGADRPCAFDPTVDWRRGASGSVLRGDALAVVGQSFSVGDVDGDGVVDVFSSGYPGFVRPLDGLDRSAGGALAETGNGDRSEPRLGDLDGDGFDDLVSYDDVWALTARFGSAAGLGAPVTLLPTEDPLMVGLDVGELTGDGVDDVVVLVNNGPARVHAAPTWQAVAEVPIAWNAHVQLGDADGDGVNDLWTTDACVYLAPLPAAGAVAEGCIDGDWSSGDIALGDADGDGTLDAALFATPTAAVFLGPWTGNRGPGDAFASVGPAMSGTSWPPAMAIVAGPTEGALAVQMNTLVADASAVWFGSIAGGGAYDLDDGVVVPLTLSAGELLAVDLDADGADELVVSDPYASVADHGYAGEVWVLWHAGL